MTEREVRWIFVATESLAALAGIDDADAVKFEVNEKDRPGPDETRVVLSDLHVARRFRIVSLDGPTLRLVLDE